MFLDDAELDLAGGHYIAISFSVIASNIEEAYDLTEGKPACNWSSDSVAVFTPCGESPVFFDKITDSDFVPLVSKRFMEFMATELSPEVQWLPITPKDEDGNVIPDQRYFIANPLDNVDCIDLDRTPHEVDPDCPDEIDLTDWRSPPVLQMSRIGDRRYFRLTQHPQTIVVREDIVRMIEEAGFTGFAFSELPTS